MSVYRLSERSGGVIGTIGPIGGSGVFSLQERYALTADNYENVSLYLKMNGANGSTTFYDSSLYGHTVTANGDAQISTAQSKFGGTSAAFDGSGDYLSVPESNAGAFGVGDFTVECWARLSVASQDGIVQQTPTTEPSWYLFVDTTIVRFGRHGANQYNSFANTLSTGEWHHIAVCRSAGSLSMFLDGVSQTISAVGGGVDAYDFSAERSIEVGRVAAFDINGYIDDLRITKGVARYTSNFTPPQREFRP